MDYFKIFISHVETTCMAALVHEEGLPWVWKTTLIPSVLIEVHLPSQERERERERERGLCIGVLGVYSICLN